MRRRRRLRGNDDFFSVMNARDNDMLVAEAARRARVRRRVLLTELSDEALAAIGEYCEVGLPVFRTHDVEGRLRTDVRPEMLQLDAARRDGKMSVYHWLVLERNAARRELKKDM